MADDDRWQAALMDWAEVSAPEVDSEYLPAMAHLLSAEMLKCHLDAGEELPAGSPNELKLAEEVLLELAEAYPHMAYRVNRIMELKDKFPMAN